MKRRWTLITAAEQLGNGKNGLGSNVASGVYLYQLKTPHGVFTKKALLIR